MPQRLRTTGRAELVELAAAGSSLLISRMLFAFAGSRRTLKIVEFSSSRQKRTSMTGPSRIAHLTRAVNVRARLGCRCLPIATTTWARLRRHGYPAQLQIGAPRHGSSDFKAHAWVEVDGEPMGEAADLFERYEPLGDPVAGRR
jgi:hypothetical protein